MGDQEAPTGVRRIPVEGICRADARAAGAALHVAVRTI